MSTGGAPLGGGRLEVEELAVEDLDLGPRTHTHRGGVAAVTSVPHEDATCQGHDSILREARYRPLRCPWSLSHNVRGVCAGFRTGVRSGGWVGACLCERVGPTPPQRIQSSMRAPPGQKRRMLPYIEWVTHA